MTNANCWPRETLKQYLNGSTDELHVAAIEAHLIDCQTCEQTLLELEKNPDTLLISMREQLFEARDASLENSENSSSQVDSNSNVPASVVQRAVDAAIRLGQPSMVSADPFLNSQAKLRQIGAYELIRPLGRGGMGLVMLARHVSLNKDVAIKILPSLIGDRPELVQRFQREIRAAGHLNHPSIVNSTDAGSEQGTHYLVMEYIDGLDLSRVARLTGPMPIADACELIRQVALGLSYAHAEGIVHRDIKPSNLMLDRAGRVKILDFGLAQLSQWDEAACELTTIGQLMGTLDYMAPEQAERAGPVDYRADLYALGATLFRLVAGRAPLAAAPHMTLLEKVRLLGTQSAPSLATLREECPPELAELVSRMLSRDPADRPPSAAHIAEALAPFCEGHQLCRLMEAARTSAEYGSVATDRVDKPTSDRLSPVPLLPASDGASVRRPPSKIGWLVAGAGLPLLMWAAIVIVLDTQKGQLVIESEVAGVNVKIASGGKLTQEISVHTGTQSTRLQADKYEITLDAASDGLSIDKDQIIVQRGATVIARITKKIASDTTDNRSVLTNPSVSEVYPGGGITRMQLPGPTLYAGKPLDEWLDVLSRDLDPKSQRETLPAITQLGQNADGPTRNRIAGILIEATIRAARTTTWDSSSANDRTGAINSTTFFIEVLKTLFEKDRFFQLLTDNVFMKDGNVTPETFAVLLNRADYTKPLDEFAQEFCLWLLDRNRFSSLSKTNAWHAVAYFETCLIRQEQSVREQLPRMIEAMQEHPDLGVPAVLMFKLPNSANVVDSAAEQSIVDLARRALLDVKSTPATVAAAASRLAITSSKVEEFRDELIVALQQRLIALSVDESRLLASVELGPPGNTYCPTSLMGFEPLTWNFPAGVKRSLQGWGNVIDQASYVGSEILAILALVERLAAQRELDAQLTSVAQLIFERAHGLAITLRRAGEVKTPNWPYEADKLQQLSKPLSDFAPSVWRAGKIFASIEDLPQSEGQFDTQLFQATIVFKAKLTLGQYDLDGDGQLSEVELAEVSRTRSDSGLLARKPPVTLEQIIEDQWSSVLYPFKRRGLDPFDANHDQKLSPDEAKALLDDSAFAAADTDHDGSLSLREFAVYYAKHHAEIVLSASQQPQSIDDQRLRWARGVIDKYDLNKDGVLTEGEWKNMVVRPAATVDANGDGRITVEEFVASRSK